MWRAKIIAKWDECGSTARWRTVWPFGFQAINCSKAPPSTRCRLPNCCDANVDLACHAVAPRRRINETAPRNSGPFVLILQRHRIIVEGALESPGLFLCPRAFSPPVVRQAFAHRSAARHPELVQHSGARSLSVFLLAQ